MQTKQDVYFFYTLQFLLKIIAALSLAFPKLTVPTNGLIAPGDISRENLGLCSNLPLPAHQSMPIKLY